MNNKDQRLFDKLTKLTDNIDEVLFDLYMEWDGGEPDLKKVKKLEKKLDGLYKKRANLISKFTEPLTTVGSTTYGAEIFEFALGRVSSMPLPDVEPFESQKFFGKGETESKTLPQPYQFQRSLGDDESGIGNILPDTFIEAYEENEGVINNLTNGLSTLEKGFGNVLKKFLKGQKTNNEKLTVIQNKTKAELQEKSKLNNNAIIDFFKTLQERFDQSKEGDKVKKKTKKSSRFGKIVDDAATPLLEGIIGFLIDLAAFKALQWLADPANRDTLKEAFDALFNFFEVAKNITIGGIKLSITVFEFFEKFTNPFEFEKKQGKDGKPRTGVVNGKEYEINEMGFKFGDSNKKLEDNNKKLSAVDKALSSLSKLGMQPAVADDGLPDQEKLNMLKEFGDVPGVDLKSLGLLDEMPDVKEFDKINKGIADAQNTLGSIDKGKKQNSGASPSSSTDIPGLESNDYKLDSDQKQALNTALKGDGDKNFKPLENTSKAAGVDGKKMKDVFELPIKAVGSSIIALSLGSIAGIPGMASVVRPIMGNIASKFGLSTSIFSRFLTAGSAGTDDFAETMKMFIKVLKGIASFTGLGGNENTRQQNIMKQPTPLSGNEKVQAVIRTANQAGMTPEELAAILALESGLDPRADNSDLGPEVYKENGPHYGLWQAGKAERAWAKDYLGLPQETDWRDVPFDQQLQALIPWAMSRGYEPGGENAQANLYSTILTGRPGNYNTEDGLDTTVNNAGITRGGKNWNRGIEWLKQNGYEGMMRGGLVQGDLRPGDSVPALLEPGEYVLNKHSADLFEQIFGKGSLDELNFTKAKRFGEKINLMGTDLKNIGSKLDMEMLKRYQKNKKVKMNDGKVNTIVLPEKINTKVNTMSETFSKGLLGDTVDVDSAIFTSMMFDYV